MVNEILLIDDNYIDNYINKRIVAQEKVTNIITVKISPIEALEYLSKKKESFPELIFLDIKMPQMDGFEFLDELSRLLDGKMINCKIVMLSSSHSLQDINVAKSNPLVLEYIVKPLSASKLDSVFKLLV